MILSQARIFCQRSLAAAALLAIVPTVAAASPPLYRIFCTAPSLCRGARDAAAYLAAEAAGAARFELRDETCPQEGQPPTEGVVEICLRAGSGGAGTRARCGVRTLLGPGDWEIAVAPPLRYYIAAILDTASGEQARRFRLEPGEDISITVLVGTRPATVKGKVTIGGTAAVGAPVFLRAADADLAVRLGGLRTVRTGPEGEYSFAGLPPGRYEVICSYQVREEEPETWPPGRATFVDVAEGEEVVQDLTVTEIR